MAGFAHLHVASGYSLRYGASTPVDLVRHAAELGQTTLALTDRDGVYGAVRFALACRDVGIAPVLGVDLAVRPTGLLPTPAATRRRRSPARGGATRPGDDLPRVVVLARGRQGWASLCRLVSAAHLSGERGEPVVDLRQVAEHHDGLIVLLGPNSECGRALTGRRPDLARAVLRQWQEVLGADVRIEVVCHWTAPPDSGRARDEVGAMSLPVAARLYGFARDSGIEPVLTNAVRHARRDQARVVDVLDAIRRLVPIDVRHLDRGNSEGYLKSRAEMQVVAEQVLTAAGHHDARREAVDWVGRTGEFARSCALDPEADLGIGSIHVPELSVLSPVGGGGADEILRRRCETALVGLPDPTARRRRLDEELATVATLGFAGYFLTVAEVVDLIRDMGVRVAARGSGAGSLINHLLGISGVDPLQHGLIMERFLSPLRRALPDIDIDVESARRTEVYERILQRFGGDRCTCVSMMDTYRVRHAVRDVGAALAFPAGDIDEFAKAFPHIAARDARAALQDLPELRRSPLGRLAADGQLDPFLDLVQALDGLPRHVALHPCGVLLSDAGLLDRTPVEASWLGFPMSQFDKDDVEELGFLKLDVLGIRMQSAMAHAVSEIGRTEGVAVDIDTVPRDDPATFDLIRSTRTLGCFQIESPGQRELIGKFAPETFDDLIIDISLFRPGPVKSDMITPFLRARHGWDTAEYLHDDLRPVLAETAGVVVFHEQVIMIISVITGCTLAEADEVRRTLGSPDGQREVRTWLYPAALSRGYDLGTVEQVWDVLRAFASFGFCKAHAAAFALPTYQSAWLKAHHPAAFAAGVLTHDPGMYPKRLILDDARRHGVPVLGLDVNRSDRQYRVERVEDRWGIRLPVAEVKGISEAEEVGIVAGRPYASLGDFWHRAQVSRPTAEHLILAGGFDDVHGVGGGPRMNHVTRRDLLLHLADLDRHGRSLRPGARVRAMADRVRAATADPRDPASAARAQSQAPAGVGRPEDRPTQLALDLADTPTLAPSGLPEMGAAEQVRAEVEILGLDVSAHLVSFYGEMLDQLGVVRARDLSTCRSEAEVLVAGVKVATQTPPVRSGRRVVFLTVDDGTGPVDTTFFEDVQGPYAATLFHSWLLLVRGVIRRTGPRGLSLRATGCWELGEIRQMWQSGGPETVQNLLADAPAPAPAVGARAADAAGRTGRRRRVLVHASGYRVSPYADVRPAGDDPAGRPAAPAKLWHSSPGSSGW
ncbi:MAG: DNA polymerase III subunit alpha [Candidatus Nanopelagicales bacterium]